MKTPRGHRSHTHHPGAPIDQITGAMQLGWMASLTYTLVDADANIEQVTVRLTHELGGRAVAIFTGLLAGPYQLEQAGIWTVCTEPACSQEGFEHALGYPRVATLDELRILVGGEIEVPDTVPDDLLAE